MPTLCKILHGRLFALQLHEGLTTRSYIKLAAHFDSFIFLLFCNVHPERCCHPILQTNYSFKKISFPDREPAIILIVLQSQDLNSLSSSHCYHPKY